MYGMIMGAGAVVGGATSFLGQRAKSKAAKQYNKAMYKAEVQNMVYRNRAVVDNLIAAQEQNAIERQNMNQAKAKGESDAYMAFANRGIDPSSTAAKRVQNAVQMKADQQLSLLNKSLKQQQRNAQVEMQANKIAAENNIKANFKSTSYNPLSIVSGAVSGAMTGMTLGKQFGQNKKYDDALNFFQEAGGKNVGSSAVNTGGL